MGRQSRSDERKVTSFKIAAKKGTREWSKQAKARFLQLAEREPDRTVESLAAAVGMGERGVYSWIYRDPEFKRSFTATRGAHTGPPPVPPFRDFRLEHLNTVEENPITLRRMEVGVTYPHMEPFIAALDDDQHKRILALWPIRHAKSKIVEQFVVHQLARNPQSRIVIVCGSEQLAKDRLYAIQTMLEDDQQWETLHRNWGPWIGKPEGRDKAWSSTYFYVRGRKGAERDPSVRAFGVKSKILGIRADLIILDDVDDPNNGPEDRRKILRNINTAIRTRLNDGGRVIVIGNRCGEDDIYSHLLARKGWWTQVLSAYKDDGTPLCPEMYSAEELDALAEDMTPAEFALMVLNEPSADEGVLFSRNLIEAAYSPHVVGDIPQGWEVIVGLDPAPVGRTAIVAVAHEPSTGEIRLLDCDVRSGAGYEGLFQMLWRMVSQYKPAYAVVEEQGGSSPVFGDYPEVRSMLISENCGYEKFHTGANKNDPRVGIGLLKDLFVRGRLRIPWGDDEARRKMKPLVDDLISFQPTFTNRRRYDTVMALWFACATIQAGRRTANVRRIPDPLYLKGYGRRRVPGLDGGSLTSSSFQVARG